MRDSLAAAFPRIGERLPRLTVADLPTPVSVQTLSFEHIGTDVAVKHDDVTSRLYGGNKVRKLEYLLQRAIDRGARRVATFGAAGSNHALATAIHANNAGLDCTCFLSHQKSTPNVGRTLNMHRQLGTEIVRWGGGIDQVTLFREHLQGRGAWVIPLGGTCWLGAVGFVAAAFELAQQVNEGLLPHPDRIYIACGTTGSAAGLALGLAAASLDTSVQAIQVADNPFASEWKMHRLMAKTQFILNRMEPSFVADNWCERITWRDEFLAGGYARVDDATAAAVNVAKDQLGLSLETTYTGKAFAALLHDLQRPDYDGAPYLYWNTYNSAPLPVSAERPSSLGSIPDDFERYFC
jgi:1-aminocyclopropane-1-carboxylate deaminase/D-cysteine desulfhydrase-like pyridoxal-dependent ACC family enzyme